MPATTSMFDFIWDELNTLRNELNERIDTVEAEIDAAATTQEIAFADLPFAVDGMSRYEVRFITDGRKQGETAGNGTGVPCYYDSASDSWLRLSDDTAVAV